MPPKENDFDIESQLTTETDTESWYSILLPSTIEAFATLTCVLAVKPFLAKNTSWYQHPNFAGSLMLISNFVLRLPTDSLLTQGVRSFLFSIFDVLYRYVLIHESGHALAMLALYKECQPQIVITPPYGGVTNYTTNEFLSTWGELLGEKKTDAFISAAGPGLELLWCYFSLIAAQLVFSRYPEIKSHLRFSVIISLFGSIWSALSATQDCEPEQNDFCNLNELSSISPLLDTGFIISSVLILQFMLCCITSIAAEKTHTEAKIEKQPLLKPLYEKGYLSIFSKTVDTTFHKNSNFSIKNELNC